MAWGIRGRGIRIALIALIGAGCATTQTNPFSTWEIVVEPFDWSAQVRALGRTDREFQTDLIRELTGARNVPARWADSDAGSVAPRALYLTGRLRSGRTNRLVIALRESLGGPVVWDNEYIIRPTGTGADIRANIIETVARDVANIVRQLEQASGF